MKPVITVNNVNSKLTCDSISLLREITKRFTVSVPNFWFSKRYKIGLWDGTFKFFKRPSNTFPTGLLPIMVEILNEFSIEFEMRDERKNPTKFPNNFIHKISLNGKWLRDYQADTVNSVLTNKIGGIPFVRGIINIATNGGKTTIAEALIANLYDKLKSNGELLLFITHSLEIANQTKKSIENDLGIEVGFIGDGKWEENTITVALSGTLYSKQKSKSPMFSELRKMVKGFIVDECHHSKADSFYLVLQDLINADIRIGLTGTIDNSNPVDEMKLYACTGGILKKVSNDFLIQNNYSAKPLCKMIKIEGDNLDHLSYREAYEKGIVYNDKRNGIIKDLCIKEVNCKNSVLVLVERVEHGKEIHKFLINSGVNSEFTNGSLSGKERENLLEGLRKGSIKILISTSILDEGVDVSNINSVIYARGMKSTRKLLQGIGRGLRKKIDGSDLKFYDFIDYSHVILLEHSLQRYNALESEGFEIEYDF